jgi:DNA-binding NtrC family response regulator
MGERILIVEDESTLCTNVARFLSRAGHTVTAVETGRAALAELDVRTFDLVITDLRLPDVDGLTVLDHVRETSPESVTLIMTAYASVDSAVEALRRGAHDYVLKPLSLADLERKVKHIAEYKRLGQENARLRTLLRGDSDALATLRRGGRAMNELADMIEKFATASSNVLVLGESGAGKELVARAIHDASTRADGPFITLNVSAIPDTLVESYLFGHEKGAFTGAERRREGLFRAASGGTLFLDEIGELPLPVQAKLLRAVETKEILPVGADRGVKVDTRIVAATHRDLPAMVQDGKFRQDLLYRLQVGQLRVPALRERPEDIATIALDLVSAHARAQKKTVHTIAPDAMALLTAYAWPGNVRELSNVLERAVILCSDDTITPIDLPTELGVEQPSSRGAPAGDAAPTSRDARDARDAPLQAEEANLERATLAFQRGHIARALDAAEGNREAAAKLLGLSPATLYRYLQKVGLKGYAHS